MAKMDEYVKRALARSFIDLATARKDGKPNVIPVRPVKAISDSQILIRDMWLNKSRKNLEENLEIALSVLDVQKFKFCQLKGKANVVKEG